MNWVDLLIIVLIVFFVADGLRRGFLPQMVELVGFVISLIFSLLLFSRLSPIFVKYFSIPESFSFALSFFVVWFTLEAVYFFAAKELIVKIPQSYVSGKYFKYAGFIPGVLNGLVFLAFILTLVVALPTPPFLKKDFYDSKLGSFLLSQTAQLEKPLSQVFTPAVRDIQKSLTFLTIKPESRESVPLDVPQKTQLTIDSSSEQKMFELVNSERAKEGLKALLWDTSLRDVGRKHSRDMFERKYFSHFSPEGKDVGDRLGEANIDYTIAGENLALAPDVIRAHDGLMNSPGHRRNILTAEFGKIGIGAIDGGANGKMFTQVFTN